MRISLDSFFMDITSNELPAFELLASSELQTQISPQRHGGAEKTIQNSLCLRVRGENPSCTLSYQHGFQTRTPALILDAAGGAGAVAVSNHAQHSCEFVLGQGGWHLRDRHRPCHTDWLANHRICNIHNSR